jgi:hypothetical protein
VEADPVVQVAKATKQPSVDRVIEITVLLNLVEIRRARISMPLHN